MKSFGKLHCKNDENPHDQGAQMINSKGTTTSNTFLKSFQDEKLLL